jgi:hypothetical protein
VKEVRDDGSIESREILTTSADGRTQTLGLDNNGDGTIDNSQTFLRNAARTVGIGPGRAGWRRGSVWQVPWRRIGGGPEQPGWMLFRDMNNKRKYKTRLACSFRRVS